jgi:hypothetical protein
MAEKSAPVEIRFRSAGEDIDAAFDVCLEDGLLVVALHAWGGGAHEKNRDYRSGLTIALQRLQAIGGVLTDALVDSKGARRLNLEHRRLGLSRLGYPVALAELPRDVDELVSELTRAAAKTARKRGAKGGGNYTRRVKLLVRVPSAWMSVQTASVWLRSGSFDPRDDFASSVQEPAPFDPLDELDARERVLRAIAARRGQPVFRHALLRAYDGACAFSGFDADEALEAAHVRPYRGRHTDHVRNGLLLRCDLHTLFDRRLTSIDVDAGGGWRVVMAESLRATRYGELHGSLVRLPRRSSDWPDPTAVRLHREDCGI